MLARSTKRARPLLGRAYASITVVSAVTHRLSTQGMFDASYVEDTSSPIDKFIDNTNKLNLIYLNATNITPELGALVVLGYMSAVEGYMRAMVRGLVNIDEYVRFLAEPRHVTFGAALHHDETLLPEALVETESFASEDGILRIVRELFGLKGHVPQELEVPLSEYKKICEIRHCCVHRFGKLGTKNAISLGLFDHKAFLEKPLMLNRAALEQVAESLRTFVKSLNNFMFQKILDRTVSNKDDKGRPMYAVTWTWDLRRDRARFKKYYDLFASMKDSRPSAAMKTVYESFRLEHQ